MRTLVMAAFAVTIMLCIFPQGNASAASDCIVISGGGANSSSTITIKSTNATSVSNTNQADVNKLIADISATPTPAYINTGADVNVKTGPNLDPCPPSVGNSPPVVGKTNSSLGPELMIFAGLGLVLLSFIKAGSLVIKMSVHRSS